MKQSEMMFVSSSNFAQPASITANATKPVIMPAAAGMVETVIKGCHWLSPSTVMIKVKQIETEYICKSKIVLIFT